MNKLLEYFKQRVFNGFTQCVMCGAENCLYMHPEYTATASQPRIWCYCAHCSYTSEFDAQRIMQKLESNPDEMMSWFSELLQFVKNLPRPQFPNE